MDAEGLRKGAHGQIDQVPCLVNAVDFAASENQASYVCKACASTEGKCGALHGAMRLCGKHAMERSLLGSL